MIESCESLFEKIFSELIKTDKKFAKEIELDIKLDEQKKDDLISW